MVTWFRKNLQVRRANQRTEKMLRKAMEDYDAKKFLAKADNLTLGQMLDVWAGGRFENGFTNNGTVGNYLQAVNRIKQHRIGNRKLKTVTSEHLQKFLTIYLHLAVRKEIFSQRVTPSTISVLSTQSCNSPSDLQSFQSSTSHSIQCSMW